MQEKQDPVLVGIGGSAGSLEAIQQLFAASEASTGCCFIVQVHQAPDTDPNLLPSLIGSHSGNREVIEAADEMEPTSEQIIVVPPGKAAVLKNGRLTLLDATPAGGGMPIDSLFRALAEDAPGRCVAVVLSGANTDGTLGAREIRETNGLVIAQSPEGAASPTMPAAAIRYEVVDLVQSPDTMMDAIISYADRAPLSSGPPADPQRPVGHVEARGRLLRMVRDLVGQDFTSYKDATIDRRIDRRMSLHQLDSIQRYLEYAQRNRDEVHALFHDLLIGVTSFFRDPDAFHALRLHFAERYLPSLDGETVRVWVPGCATGEEAYSIAMTIRDALSSSSPGVGLIVYATDIDESAIEIARAGRHPRSIESDIPEDLLRRYFFVEKEHYVPRPVLREAMVFAVQNVAVDPPFSRVDVVSCRNMLIYLKQEAQDAVLARIRYALKPGGLLFLGSAEGVGSHTGAFEEVDGEHRIYRRMQTADTDDAAFLYPVWSQVAGAGGAPASPPPERERRLKGAGRRSPIEREAEQIILDYAAPAVLVTRDGRALYFHGRTGKYFEPAPGTARNNVIEMAREGLGAALSATLNRAESEGRDQVRAGVPVRVNDHEESVDLFVRCAEIESYDQPCYLITLIERPDRDEEPTESEDEFSDEATRRIAQLERELASLREDMRALVSEYEARTQELKSSNEELQSTNEELKSSNEELETSKEELQSVNEEQHTLNSELRSANEDLARVRDDMDNLLAGTQVATLFLDENRTVRRFTPAMNGIVGLRESDIGRPIDEMSFRVEYTRLQQDVRHVLERLEPVERQVHGDADTWFQLRIMPYRTRDNRIAGVVMTFIDITALKRSEQEAMLAQSLAESALNLVEQPLLVVDAGLTIGTANRAFLAHFGLARDDVLGRTIEDLSGNLWEREELERVTGPIIGEERSVSEASVNVRAGGDAEVPATVRARAIPSPRAESARILISFSFPRSSSS